MSYDIEVKTSEDGKEWKSFSDESINMTYNVNPMLVLAFDIECGSFGEWSNEQPCLYMIDKTEKALVYFAKNKVKLEALNSSNGWGDYYGAYEFIGKIHTECLKYPKGKVFCY